MIRRVGKALRGAAGFTRASRGGGGVNNRSEVAFQSGFQARRGFGSGFGNGFEQQQQHVRCINAVLVQIDTAEQKPSPVVPR